MEFKGTGIEGPGADLWFSDVDGAEHVAIAYHPQHREHEILDSGLDEFRPFLTDPGIEGVLALEAVPRPGVFVYDLRGGLTVAEILAASRSSGEPGGQKAAMELLVQGAEVLADATDAGREVGLPNHGDLSPWRLIVDDEGYLDVLGYGLLNLSVVAFLDERADTVPADGLRYAPPERLELQAEDVLSDLFSLALIAIEVLTGKPLIEGDAEAIIETLLAGEVPAAIEEQLGDAPDSILDVLCIATELDATQRYADVDEFIRAAKVALKDAEGPTLREWMQRSRGVDVRAPLESGAEPPVADEPEPEPPAEAPQPEPQASAPAEPEPEPEPEPDPEPEPEPEPALDDPFGPPPVLPPLPDDADLDRVKQRAAEIISRIEAIVERARAISETGTAEAESSTLEAQAIARGLSDAVGRTEKAHASAQRSAGLVELDDEASEALVTVGFITAAEQQAENALKGARESLGELRGVLRAARAEQERIERLKAEIERLATEAREAWEGGKSRVDAVQGQVDEGSLGAPGVEDAVERARGALDRGRVSMLKAVESVDEVATATAAADAEAYAGTAREGLKAVQGAISQADTALEAARSAEQAGLQSVRGEIEAASRTAAAAHEQAQRAVARARTALEQGPSEEASALFDKAEALLATTKRAASDAALEARSVADSASWTEARGSLAPATQASRSATEATEEVESLVDRAISIAQNAAQAAQALGKARSTADKLLEKSRNQVLDARDKVATLVTDTEELQGSRARELVETAQDELADAEDALTELEEKHGLIARMSEVAEVEKLVSRMRPLATTCTQCSLKAIDADQRCREIAADELREIIAERRRMEKLDEHGSAAASHAKQAKAAVDAAWKRYRGLPPQVKETDIQEARELLSSAYEAIDIAQFQAKEATNAAKDAKRQADPAEARGYAETAESFWERVREDLPEALRAIDEAEEMVMREVRLLEEARQRTAQAAEQAFGDRDTLGTLQGEAEQLASEWPRDRAVQGALERVRRANGDLDKDLGLVEEARDQALESDDANAAQSVVGKGEGAARRVADRRKAAEAALGDLKKAVQVAREEAAQVAALRKELAGLVDKAEPLAKGIFQQQKRLDESVAGLGSSGDPVTRAQARVAKHATAARSSVGAIRTAHQAVQGTSSGTEAEGHAAQARQAFEALQTAGEKVVEDVETGIQAAQDEADARKQAEEKRKTEARDAAGSSASKARDAVAAVRHAMQLAKEIVDKAPDGQARVQLDEAGRLLDKLVTLANESDAAAARAASADDASEVLAAGMDAREAAQRSSATSRHALDTLREAQSLAEAEIKQAEALAGIKKEMQDLAERADAAISMAKEQSVFLDEVLEKARTDETRALRKQADDAIANARKAATKVHTALPMVADAENLQVAQHMLRAAEKAVTKATKAADQVPQLLERAKERLVEEADELQRALEAARAEALQPLEPANAAAEKARTWLDQGQAALADHSDEEGIAEAFGQLSGALSEMESRLLAAEEAGAPIHGATTQEEVAPLAAALVQACDAVLESVKQAKEHHQALTEAVAGAVARAEELQKTKDAVKQGAEEAAARLEALRTDFQSFENEIGDTELDEAETADLVDQVEDFLRVANDAVHRARKATEAVEAAEDHAGVMEAGEAAEERTVKARESLDGLEKGLKDGRDELARMLQELEARRRQEEEAKRLREIEEKRDREREERRASRPGGRGLRPAGPPRGSASRLRRPDRGGDSDAQEEAEERSSGSRRSGRRELRRPSRSGKGSERRLRRPSRRSSEDGDSERRLRRPSRRSKDGDDKADATDRRLRRPSRRSKDGEAAASGSRSERRLRRPSRLSKDGDGDGEASSSGRRLRRPSRASGDEGRRPRRGSADRRLKRPSRSGDGTDSGESEGPETSGSSSRDDLRSRLREKRASQMAGNRRSGPPKKPAPRPGRGAPRPGKGGPRGRLPSRPGGKVDPESGADLLKRRIKERGSRPPSRSGAEDADAATPGRSVDDLMARMKRSKNKDKGED